MTELTDDEINKILTGEEILIAGLEAEITRRDVVIEAQAKEIERLQRLEAAIKRGVEQVQYLNNHKGQLDYMAQMEARSKMDASWAEILSMIEAEQ